MTPFERRESGYWITTDPARLDVDAIHAYLTRSYWASGIPRATVARSLEGSLCFGLYTVAPSADSNVDSDVAPDVTPDAQVGFARVISDRATFAYLCDVYVLEEHRGRGLAKGLMRAVVEHPELAGLRRFMLATRDAHGLYAAYGFTPLARPETFMEIARPGLYEKGAGGQP